MGLASPSIWEWRAFVPAFEPLAVAWPPEFEAADDVYIVCPESDTRAIMRGDALLIDVLEQSQDGLERWRRSFEARFPLCQHDVRDALRQFPVALPVLNRAEYNELEFTTEVATCTNGLRVVGVRSVRRDVRVDGCMLERSTVSLAGTTMQTIAVKGADAPAVLRIVRDLRLNRFAARNMVDMIKELLGVSSHAYAVANH